MLNTPYSMLWKWFYLGFILAFISIFALDNIVYQILNRALVGQQDFWEKVTYIGDSEWMAVLCLLAIAGGLLMSFLRPSPVWTKLWRSATLIFASVATVGLAALLIKRTIGRARPYLYDTEGPHSFMPFQFDNLHAGFPSGHTTTAFAFATAVTILFPRLAIPTFAIAFLAGFSRMAVNAHYLGDVIAGATFGIILTIAVAKQLHPKLIK